MVYQGSKNRLAKYLVPIIQKYIRENNINTYIELMAGGCNIIDKISCKNKIARDINEPLIKLLRYIQKDNSISIAPETCSFEHYADVRTNQNSGKYLDEYVALIGYCGSYGGRYFDGGYARDRSGKRNIFAERVENLRNQASKLNDIDIDCCDFKDFDVSEYSSSLFYFDPPYRDTKKYISGEFDYDYFYNFCRKLSRTNTVLISEYWMPDDFKCIWEKQRKVMQKSDRLNGEIVTEKLYTIN